MSYEYETSLPFEYKKFLITKKCEFTDEIRRQFEDFYKYIMELDKKDYYLCTNCRFDEEKIKGLVQDLSAKYQTIRNEYIKPVVESQYSYARLPYTQEEVDFIFICSYWLIDKFGLPQAKLSKIWGMKNNKFAKLDCFPDRCYKAYTKVCNKSLIPYNENSEGIRIAQYINKNVQAKYACSGFVGITNDLDVFANVSTTDSKYFVLTSPLQFEDEDTSSIEKANYSFARFLFALGNQLFDDNDMYVPAGEIKNKIVKMLKMDDISAFSIAEQDALIRKMLLSDTDLKDFMLVGYRYSDFQLIRKDYRLAYENMNIELEKLEDDYVNYFVEQWRPYSSKDEELDNDELIRELYNYYKKNYECLEQSLLRYINIQKLFKSQCINLNDWLEIIRKNVKSNVIAQNPTYEERLKCAASFWISEVFADYDGNEELYDRVLTYLGEKSLLFDYFDVLNAPPSGKMKDASSQERTNIHIYMRDEKMDISAELKRWNIKPSENSERPLMVYLDTDAVEVNESIIYKLVNEQRAIVIVHDKSGLLQNQKKENELDLYIIFSAEVE